MGEANENDVVMLADKIRAEEQRHADILAKVKNHQARERLHKNYVVRLRSALRSVQDFNAFLESYAEMI
ncbi:MAG: hypothetical protein PHV68_10440 [Candidatus Gastranaerophilales bacterium]|nr:hypothetical protein [Candidatus Gastranaerophilales bacterium]